MEWSTDYGEKGSARNALRIAAITGVLAAPSAILLVDRASEAPTLRFASCQGC
jgi:hypothetical protein